MTIVSVNLRATSVLNKHPTVSRNPSSSLPLDLLVKRAGFIRAFWYERVLLAKPAPTVPGK
jgi:hypothetical protein